MKKLEPLLFAVGAALFGILLHHFGVKQLVENIRHTGAWTPVPRFLPPFSFVCSTPLPIC